MSESFNIAPVVATKQNALLSQEIIYTDLRRLGMSHEEAIGYANPDDNQKVDRQYKKLDRAAIDEFSRTSYFGAYAGRNSTELVAFVKLGSWAHGDQVTYENGQRKKLEHIFARKLLDHLGQSRKRGIHHLSAHERLDADESYNAIYKLGSYVAEICDSSKSDIYVPLTPTDPAMEPLIDLGFKTTRKTGSPIGSVEQTLFVRKSA